MTHLLPCPFCGEKRISLNEPTKEWPRGSINCPGCLVTMPGEIGGGGRISELILSWNARVEEWQPIDTYEPGHECGSEVLVAHEGIVSEAYYNGESDSWWMAQTSEHDSPPGKAIYPTHWRDKPAPPVISAD